MHPNAAQSKAPGSKCRYQFLASEIHPQAVEQTSRLTGTAFLDWPPLASPRRENEAPNGLHTRHPLYYSARGEAKRARQDSNLQPSVPKTDALSN